MAPQPQTIQQVLALANLGGDFDVGNLVAGKLNINRATTTVPGLLALASATDITNGTAGKAVGADQLKLVLAKYLGNLQGGWNAATNTPQLLSGVGTQGYLYRITTAGVSNATTAAAASTTTSISVASATGIAVGQSITGTGVPSGTTVASISGTTVTASQAVSIANGAALTFATYLDGAGPFYAGDLVEFDGTQWDKLDGSPDETVNVQDAFGNHLYFAAP